MQKLLIDENLSPSLTAIAHSRGFVCSHVSHLGLAGDKDWEIKRTILDGDWTFVTANSVDFRGTSDFPGTSGEYADVELHAGLICINAPGGLNRSLQRQLFSLVLDELESASDLTNQVLELDLDRKGKVTLRRYRLPQVDLL